MALSQHAESYLSQGIANRDAASEIVTAVNANTSGLATANTDIDTLQANAITAQAQINVPLGTGVYADGTPLAAFATSSVSTPGLSLVNSKCVGIRWNNAATHSPIWYSVPFPQDLNSSANVILHALASKTGSNGSDATTLTVAGFFQTPGALHDADADVGGASGAVSATATSKTVTELTRTIALANVPANPSGLSFSIKPTDGTLATDDFVVSQVWFEYTRQVLSS